MRGPDVRAPGRSGRLAGRALHTREATRWLQQAQEQGLSAPSFLGENLIRDVGGGRRVCAVAATVPAPRASEAACALRRGRAGAGGRVGGRGPGVGSGLRPGAESQEEMGCCCSGPRRRPSRRNEEARGWQGGPRRGGDVGRPGGELEPSRWWRSPRWALAWLVTGVSEGTWVDGALRGWAEGRRPVEAARREEPQWPASRPGQSLCSGTQGLSSARGRRPAREWEPASNRPRSKDGRDFEAEEGTRASTCC